MLGRRPNVSCGGRGFWSGAIALRSPPNSRRLCSKHSPMPPDRTMSQDRSGTEKVGKCESPDRSLPPEWAARVGPRRPAAGRQEAEPVVVTARGHRSRMNGRRGRSGMGRCRRPSSCPLSSVLSLPWHHGRRSPTSAARGCGPLEERNGQRQCEVGHRPEREQAGQAGAHQPAPGDATVGNRGSTISERAIGFQATVWTRGWACNRQANVQPRSAVSGVKASRARPGMM